MQLPTKGEESAQQRGRTATRKNRRITEGRERVKEKTQLRETEKLNKKERVTDVEEEMEEAEEKG